jgi:integrase/recombinase XerD
MGYGERWERKHAALILLSLRHHPHLKDLIIASSRNGPMTAASVVNWFWHLYRRLGLSQCSSHLDRRTFMTNATRKISDAGGSLGDVQRLAGHANLATTQRYIEGSDLARK